jgi:type 1 glutamine amidotransferase
MTSAKLLVYTRTTDYRHASTERSVAELTAIASTLGVACETTEDPAAFRDARLAEFGAVCFFNTSGDVLDLAGRSALESFVRAGGGFFGVHAAAASEPGSPFYEELVGAYFSAHPEPQLGTLVVEARTHPATRALPERLAVHEEWYGFRRNPRDRVRVLLRVDETSYAPRASAMGEDHPIAWCHERFGGRALYTALGHDSAIFDVPQLRAHFQGALAWTLGLENEDI